MLVPGMVEKGDGSVIWVSSVQGLGEFFPFSFKCMLHHESNERVRHRVSLNVATSFDFT